MKLKKLASFLVIVLSHNALAESDIVFKSSFEFISKFNDTGISWAAEYPSGNNLDCTSTSIASPQDCNIGQDFTDNDDSNGHAGFSYTKLDVSGNRLVDQSVDYTTNPWACVKDNVTGLVWEVKTITAGIHNKNNTYRWGGISAIGLGHPNSQGVYYSDWNTLINGSNTEVLCGLNNWRVPTFVELFSIVDKGVFNPSLDINYFPNTAGVSWFWSSTPETGTPENALDIFFLNSNSNSNNRSTLNNVRLVSSGQ